MSRGGRNYEPTGAKPQKGWHDEAELARAKELWLAGYSCAQVAKMVNHEFGRERTRNAVIGVISRAGMKRPDAMTFIRAGARRGGAIRREQRKALEPAETAPSLPVERAFAKTPTSVTFLAREFGQCSWPVELNADVPLCCGGPVAGRGPYCAAHARISIRKAA